LLSIASFIYLFIWEENNKPELPAVNIENNGEDNGKSDAEGTTGEKNILTETHNPLKEIPEDVVLLIVQNPDYSVPPNFNFSKRDVVFEYISSCENIIDLEKRVNCLDVYFLNNVPVLKPLLENCTEGDRMCLDTYYLEAAMYGGQAYCNMIITQSLKEECDAWK
jgi:hypothetical protein